MRVRALLIAAVWAISSASGLVAQDVPILVHFGPEKTENWLLARWEASEEDADDS